jgi:hypothetical protein
MDGSPPVDRPVPNRKRKSWLRGRRPEAGPPVQPPGGHWLNDFLQRESMAVSGGMLSVSTPVYRRAEKSYTSGGLVGVILLSVGVIGAATYYNVILGTASEPGPAIATTVPDAQKRVAVAAVPVAKPGPDHRAVPSLAALTTPPPDHQAAPSLATLTVPPPDHRALPLLAALTTPPPDHRALPSLAALTTPPPDHRAAPSLVALTMPPPDHRAAPAAAVAVTRRAPAHLPTASGADAMALTGYSQQPVDPSQAVSSNWVVALIVSKPPVDKTAGMAPAKPAAVHVAPLAVPPLPDVLPTGSALHLWIVYQPSDPAAGSKVDALTSQLRSQISDITSATASVGPAATESVVYFFPSDRAGASRIAASLARMTGRTEPVMLVHADHLPRPGTVEIRLPFKVGEELSNEGD